MGGEAPQGFEAPAVIVNGFDEHRQEDGRGRPRSQPKSKACVGPHFGHVADRIGLELVVRFVAFKFRQTRNATSPQAAVKLSRVRLGIVGWSA